jgi:hypothetical protein
VTSSAAELPLKLVEPDLMLPVQVQPRARADVLPEMRLMVAVLQDAVDCIRKRSAADPTGRTARDAAAWMSSRDTDWPFSFERICEALGLDADRVRAVLLP